MPRRFTEVREVLTATTVVYVVRSSEAWRSWHWTTRVAVALATVLGLTAAVLIACFPETVRLAAARVIWGFLVGAPLEWFFAMSVSGFVVTLYAAVREHRNQMNLLAFDLMRASVVTHGLWITATASALWAPELMLAHIGGGDSGPSRLTFFWLFAVGVGWFFIALFRIHANTGRHPWQYDATPPQRPSIEEAAVHAATT